VKSLRHIVPMLATLALALILSGCGNDSTPTGVNPIDDTPPAAPAQVGVSSDPVTGNYILEWTASTSPGVTGYQVFLYSPSPDRDNAYQLVFESDENGLLYPLPRVSMETEQIYRVRAVSTSGTRSNWSDLALVTLTPPRGDETTKDPLPRRPTAGDE